MKFSCLQENLIKGLSVASRNVSSKSALPVLSHILLSVKKEGVFLLATNLETGVKYSVPAKIMEEGEISVPARLFLEYVATLPPGRVDLEEEGSRLSIKSGSYEAKIDGMGGVEFPKLPVFSGDPLLRFKKNDFAKVIARVCLAAATDEGRPVLTGVKTIIRGGVVTFAATDGYRLSVMSVGEGGEKKKETTEMSMIIPSRSLLEAGRVLADLGEKDDLALVLTEEKNQAVFVVSGVELSTRLIEGGFPNFEKIVPSSSVLSAEVPVDEFLKAVRTASVFARDSANIIKLQFSSQKLIVSANTPQVGSNVSLVEIKAEGEGVEVAFNSRFLLEFLGNLTAKTVVFSSNGSLNPGLFKVPGESDFLHIIMPVRVQ